MTLPHRPHPDVTGRWRSPLRGRQLTSILSLVLLATLPLVALTGLLDYIAYGPRLHQAYPADVGPLHLPYFVWPTRPVWLFRLTQGLHVVLGIVMIPVVVAKLWSVLPKLFTWPPARSVPHLLERLSLLMLVGGVLFEIVTGVLNVQYDYIFGFSFYPAHYYGAWVFLAGFVMHVLVSFPRMVRALRLRPEPTQPDELRAQHPDPATLSRRGFLGLVGGGCALLTALTAGQVIGGPARQLAYLLPRGRSYGEGPNGFQVNHTAAAYGVHPADIGPGWRLTLSRGPHRMRLDRQMLAALPQHTATLPIACVEGWSTVQEWSGVRLRDLAALAGVRRPESAMVRSVARRGAFNQARLHANQVRDPDALLALRVGGVDLSVDHGYPARVIVPAIPGVHATKWVSSIEFQEG